MKKTEIKNYKGHDFETVAGLFFNPEDNFMVIESAFDDSSRRMWGRWISRKQWAWLANAAGIPRNRSVGGVFETNGGDVYSFDATPAPNGAAMVKYYQKIEQDADDDNETTGSKN